MYLSTIGGDFMSDMMLVKEAATLWGVTERRITSLCKEGKIEGARKEGRSWVIPTDAKKPVDNRIKSGAYLKPKGKDRLPLPIGVSEYRIASTKYYYIDKTMLIKDFLDECPKVSLFTRPRRFGKTLNMDMLRTFLKKQMKILLFISKIRRYGNVARNIRNTKESFRSFLCRLRILSLTHGRKR